MVAGTGRVSSSWGSAQTLTVRARVDRTQQQTHKWHSGLHQGTCALGQARAVKIKGWCWRSDRFPESDFSPSSELVNVESSSRHIFQCSLRMRHSLISRSQAAPGPVFAVEQCNGFCCMKPSQNFCFSSAGYWRRFLKVPAGWRLPSRLRKPWLGMVN